jgi:hypothetical protein
MKVTVELDELAELHSTAKLSEYRQLELQHAQKEIEDLRAELAEYQQKGSVTA